MNKLLSTLCLLFLCHSAMAQTRTVTFKPGPATGEDAMIMTSYGCTFTGRSAPQETQNFGSEIEIDYIDWTYYAGGCSHGTTRSLIRFSALDTLPECSKIISARLNLFGVLSSGNYGNSGYPGSPVAMDNEGWVERVTSPWTEAGVTWNTRPGSTTLNRVAIPPSTSRFGYNISVDVTALVADILASGSNNGFLLQLQNEATYRSVLLASSDNADNTLWPELEVTYSGGGIGGALSVHAGNDTFGCIGEKIPLLATGADTYSWSPAGDLSNGNIPNPVLTVSGPGVYIVTGTRDGCSDKDTIIVSEQPGPLISAIPADATACPGATIQLLASGGTTYQWSPALNLSAANIPDPVATFVGPVSYVVKGTDAKGCIGFDTVNISPGEHPVITATASKQYGCIGDTLQLSAGGGKSYTWFPPTGLSSDNISNPVLTISGRVTYVVTGKDSSRCAGTDTLLIEPYPVTRIHASTDNNTFSCRNPEVVLHASGGEQYSWSPAVYCDDPDAASTRVRPPHNLVFTVNSTDKNGCKASDTISVVYSGDAEVSVPNAFTPNGDQLNDKIRPYIFCDFTLKEFAVYNRWGQLVFSTNDINQAWDGSCRGMPLNSGVYLYYIKGVDSRNEELLLKGDITLIR